MTFADIGDSFLHQVNDTTRGSNNDMHCGKERWGGGGGEGGKQNLTLFLW